MAMPLEGVRVMDWTIWQQGPVATAMLGDLGAEVIKIEERERGDPGRGMFRVRGLSAEMAEGRNFYFETNNRNKKSMTLDIRKEGAREVVYRMAEKCDVFVQNFRQGVAAKWGLDYPALSRRNPRIIYATASGYGPLGPDSREPAMDYLGLARSGIMNAMGEPGMDPLGVVGGLADQMGAIVTAYGVLAAVVARERYGVGQEVDVSHLGSMTALQALNVAAACLLGRELPRQERAMAFNPLWNHYQCGDKRWLALAHLQPDRYWPDFCRAMGVPELESDPRFEDAQCREENGGELVAILDKIFATRSCDDWLAHLKKTGDFICTRVNTVTDLVKDPQIIENEYIQDFDHPVLGKIKIVGLPVRLSKTPGSVRLAAPDFGQHTEEVLQEVAGYTWEEIEKLKQEGVI